MSPYLGQCLCGGIRYQVDQIEPQMGHCHCGMCRKFHGAAYATYGEAKQEHFHWLSGQDLLRQFKADNGTTRQFCGRCGSSLTFAPANDNGKLVEFSLGTLDSDIDEAPDAHIYTAYKANWSQISDDLPQYPEGREDN
ncbi:MULTISPECIES: GFA family protein [unclassified Agarivorans]|uniref:GFA family protein n=1 Tax=unclassified Agarivorans TaxID=2636026 RepID=UPI003D7EFEBC